MAGPANRDRDLRRAGLVLGALLALGYGVQQIPGPPAAAPVTAAGQTSANLLAAPAQSALDQILGPGHSVVTAAATYRQASSKLTTSYAPQRSAVLAQAGVSAPGYTASTTQNGVGQVLTRSIDPGGQIQRLTVAVVVDSALRPRPNPAAIGKTVSAAMGLRPSRGDRLSVVALPMPAPAAAVRAGPGTVTRYLRSGLAAALAAVLLLLLLMDVLLRRRRA